jgi:large subunit ribosomal protein L23
MKFLEIMSSKIILKAPILSEKSMRLVSEGKYVFEVDRGANKKEIATAVKRLFEVDGTNVRTFLRKGKSKRSLRTRKTIHRALRKFAVVTLKTGQKIEGFDQLLKVDNAD